MILGGEADSAMATHGGESEIVVSHHPVPKDLPQEVIAGLCTAVRVAWAARTLY